MIRFGVVGTNFITDEFIRCGKQVEGFHLAAVYSRTEERARQYAEQHGAQYWFTDLEAMAQSAAIDAVYIASPNSFHAPQALLCMRHGKHVLCEKPMASNTREVREMIRVAREQKVLLMEALKTLFLPNFHALREALPEIGRIRRYVAQFCQYSSRYDRYMQGERPNAFQPEFSNGTLMDLGVYCIQPLISLFGKPRAVKANAVMLPTGVDGQSSLLLSYEEMEAVLFFSKITDSFLPSEIQGEKGCLQVDKISIPTEVRLLRKGEARDLTRPQGDHMTYEIEEFIGLLRSGKTESEQMPLSQSLAVMEVLEEARRQLGILYPADQE